MNTPQLPGSPEFEAVIAEWCSLYRAGLGGSPVMLPAMQRMLDLAPAEVVHRLKERLQQAGFIIDNPNLTTAFYETAGAYFALKAKGFQNVLVAMRARANMMRHVPPKVEYELGEVGKRTFLTKEGEYEAEDEVMRAGWRDAVKDIKARLQVCKVEDTARELYLILQDSNRLLGVDTEPFGPCAPLIGPAIEAANVASRELLNKVMGKGGAS